MLNKDQFEKIIKDNLVGCLGEEVFGYEIESSLGRIYSNYYRKDIFDMFIKEMKDKYESVFLNYKEGKGGELKVKKYKCRYKPPKMASVASSSRFCYLALRNGAQALGGSGIIKFEHECRINGIKGTAPQLDAYIENENIYVEAKCQEIFEPHSVCLSAQYWNYFYGKDNDFGFEEAEKTDEKEIKIPLSIFDVNGKKSMFDTKQFLCHLLAIASTKEKDKHATLVYMFYVPIVKDEKIKEEFVGIFSNLSDEIKSIFNSEPIKRFIEINNIKLKVIIEYSKVMEALSCDNMIRIV